MAGTFMTKLRIENVRHLRKITISLSETERKPLILTGKNGSGKTSVLMALKQFFRAYVKANRPDGALLRQYLEEMKSGKDLDLADRRLNAMSSYERRVLAEIASEDRAMRDTGIEASMSENPCARYYEGTFLFAYYGDHRNIDITIPDTIERIKFKDHYALDDHPGKDLVKYLLNLKATQAFAKTSGNQARAQEIQPWFDRFQDVLRKIYDSPSLELKFNIETFDFTIEMDGREPFDFNTMSMGYAAVFDIISDLMMRMESTQRGRKDYDLEGLVLIDEIETHLHVKLQKEIMPILMKLFPNIQFVVTTHSPFVLNSTPNAVIYDLENDILVEDGLTNLPYEGVVEGYFGAERMSQELKEKFERYQVLSKQEILTDQEWVELDGLELYLDEVPDFLALDFATEYRRLKLESAERD